MNLPSSVLSLARVVWHRHRLRDVLLGLNDHDLADMGLERGMIDAYLAEALPWPVAPVAAERRIVVSLQGCG